MRYLDWLGRARVTWNAALAAGLVVLGLAVGGAIGRYTSPDQPWPYDVMRRELASDRIARGDEIAMRRLIEYHDEDCWRQYDRRAVSQTQTGPQPGRVERFEPVVERKLPLDLSSRWQTWTATIPADFPCGPAYLAETVTAACTWWQRVAQPLTKPTIITPFTVVCPPPT